MTSTNAAPADRAIARAVRRETHPSRSVPAIAVALVVVLVAVWLGVESVLALLDRGPLLVTPDAVLSAVADLAAPTGTAIAVAALAALVGLALVLVAVVPGRRDRRPDAPGRTAALVDDRVLASELARRAATTARVAADQVVVTIGRRDADVRITPSSGREVPVDAVRAAVADATAAFGVTPALRPRVTVEQAGRVGA